MDGPRRSHHLAVAPLQPSRGIDQKTIPLPDPGDHRVDHLECFGLGIAALGREIGHFEGIDQRHQRPQRQEPVDAAEDQRSQRASQPQMTQHQRRINVGRVVGQNERRPGEAMKLLGAGHGNPVSQPEEQAGQKPEQPIEKGFHSGFPTELGPMRFPRPTASAAASAPTRIDRQKSVCQIGRNTRAPVGAGVGTDTASGVALHGGKHRQR